MRCVEFDSEVHEVREVLLARGEFDAPFPLQILSLPLWAGHQRQQPFVLSFKVVAP